MYLDLTLELSAKTPIFPGSPEMIFQTCATFEKDGFNEKRFTINTHFGTHIDAPFHMTKDGKKLGEFPLETFINTATVIDVTESGEITPNQIPDKRETPILLLRSNHSKKVFESEYFESQPVISETAAQKIADLKYQVVGIDFASPDKEPYNVHKILFAKDILIIENLINLDQLPKTCKLIIAPLNLKDADGAPCRVIAEI